MADMEGAFTELRAVTGAVTYGELAALRRRLWAAGEGAFRWLGQNLATTGEDRQRIEAGFEAEVRRAIGAAGSLGELCAELRTEIAPVLPFGRLLSRYPILGRSAVGPEVEVWRILARFGGVLEVEGDWAAVPDLASAVALTRSAIEDSTSERTPAELMAAKGFTLTIEELVAWLRRCGYVVTAEDLHERRRSLGRVKERPARRQRAGRGPTSMDQVAELLAEAGAPLHLDEILQRLEHHYSKGPMDNRLARDDRFVRVAPATFALAEWGLEPEPGYRQSSAELAIRLLSTAGRPLHLEEIFERLGKTVTRSGLRNALDADPRIIRVAPATYAVP